VQCQRIVVVIVVVIPIAMAAAAVIDILDWMILVPTRQHPHRSLHCQ